MILNVVHFRYNDNPKAYCTRYQQATSRAHVKGKPEIDSVLSGYIRTSMFSSVSAPHTIRQAKIAPAKWHAMLFLRVVTVGDGAGEMATVGSVVEW